MRSATGTKSGEPSFVALSTKATIAFFEALSFHDGNGSAVSAGNARLRTNSTINPDPV
jgi:hypothetical protein